MIKNLKTKMKKKIFRFIYLFINIIFLIFYYILEDQKKEIKNKKKEIKRMEIYYNICSNGNLLNRKNYKKVKVPKISIISPIFNKEKYILRFLRSIENQYFQEIEIIFVDDCSKDNSVKEIENFQKEDKRIILIKHNSNKGTLMISKGKYIIFGDPDDLFSNDIFYFCFKNAENYNFDMIRYNAYNGKGLINLDFIVNNLKKKTIYQPELSLYLFNGLGKLEEIDYFIWNKLIKKEIFILALNMIDKYYLSQYMIDCEDGLLNFMLYKVAKSYYFIKRIGYYYILNKDSITDKKKKNNFKKRLKSNFLYFKFLFQHTKNNRKEKKIAEYIFFSIYNFYKNDINKLIKEMAKDLEFYIEIINLYLNCQFISKNRKMILKKMKSDLYYFKNKI